MRRSRRVCPTLLIAILLSAPFAAAQQKVAQLSEARGQVAIHRATNDTIVLPQMDGGRVRDGAVFEDDQIATGADASASMLFADCSTLDLAASTALTARHVDLSALVKKGQARQQVRRAISLAAGSVEARITSSSEVATELETVHGMVAVHGTHFRLTTSDALLAAETLEGTVEVSSRASGLTVVLEEHESVEVRPQDDGTVAIDFGAGGKRPTAVRLPDGRLLAASPGTRLAMSRQGFSARLEVAAGSLTLPNGKTVDAGKTVGYAFTEFVGKPGKAVGQSTIEGSVEFFNARHGLEVTVGTGFGIVASETADGQLRVEASGTNPGDMEASIGNRLIAVGIGSDVSLRPACGRTSLRIGRGKASFLDQGAGERLAWGECGEKMAEVDLGGLDPGCDVPDIEAAPPEEPVVPEEQPPAEEEEEPPPEEEEPLTVECGECGVAIPGGGCQDVDALCPDEQCLRDRRCAGGRCVGGRRLTSYEDPNCL